MLFGDVNRCCVLEYSAVRCCVIECSVKRCCVVV